MPIYEYKCDNCGLLFEHSAAMTEAPLQTKPGCVAEQCQLQKLISRCSAVIAGRNIVSALKEASAAAAPKAVVNTPSAHTCSFYCDHKG